MNLDATQATQSRERDGDRSRRVIWGPGGALLLFLSAGLGAVAVLSGHRLASSAVVDLGPTDAHYVKDFREIERDGEVYFRWSAAPSSRVLLPVRACGPGAVRLRVRRHFVEPATLAVSLSGSVLGSESVQARDDHPYEVLVFPFTRAICELNSEVILESLDAGPRGLGVAVDWIEISSRDGFRPSPLATLRGALFFGLVALVVCLAGSGARVVLVTIVALALGTAALFASGPVAAERIFRGGLAGLVLTTFAGAGILWLAGCRNVSARARTGLALVTLITLLSRLAFLHAQAFYPDYRVHDLVQQTLSRQGLPAFLDHLFETQYARSLGLQQIGGRWYPFPYPPLAYVLTSLTGMAFKLDAAEAVMVTAASAASLIPPLTFVLGVALGLGETVSLAGALFVGLQPLLVRRMALGYFPAVIGQSVDALALLLLITALLSKEAITRRFVGMSAALLAAFVTYTQSIANFGLLMSGLLCLELFKRSSPTGGGRVARIALAGAIALLASGGVFYYRYIPVFQNVSDGRVQPESRILDRLEQTRAGLARPEERAAESDDLADDDPFTGPTFSPVRGIGRLVARLWRFNGVFVAALAVGGLLLWRVSAGSTRNMLLAWAGVSVWISLLAAGLPSPNGFQHLKDLEFTAPLAGLAMGELTRRLWSLRPAAGALFVVAWVLFSIAAFAGEFSARLLLRADF